MTSVRFSLKTVVGTGTHLDLQLVAAAHLGGAPRGCPATMPLWLGDRLTTRFTGPMFKRAVQHADLGRAEH